MRWAWAIPRTAGRPAVGDFHIVVQPGTYAMHVSAEGYETKTIQDVVVNTGGATSVGVVGLVADATGDGLERFLAKPDVSHIEYVDTRDE